MYIIFFLQVYIYIYFGKSGWADDNPEYYVQLLQVNML